MAEIALEKLTKVYGDGTRAVSELDLEIDDGEFVVLVGPSGCGKTSALRMVAGRQPLTDGRVVIGGEVVNELPPKDLDAKLRVEMRAEIARLQRELGVTTIYVTHDQVEAMTLGDRVAIMRDGVLQQVAKPQELYDRPRNLFVAEFIGSPAMNLIGADIERSDGDLVARFGERSLRVGERVAASRPALQGFEGKRVILGVRPEDIEDASFGSGEPFGAVVDIREDMGSEVFVHFDPGAQMVAGEDVKAAVGEDAAEVKGSAWVARLDRDTAAAERKRIELAVDTNRLHFFDPETGDAIY